MCGVCFLSNTLPTSSFDDFLAKAACAELSNHDGSTSFFCTPDRRHKPPLVQLALLEVAHRKWITTNHNHMMQRYAKLSWLKSPLVTFHVAKILLAPSPPRASSELLWWLLQHLVAWKPQQAGACARAWAKCCCFGTVSSWGFAHPALNGCRDLGHLRAKLG